jgi:hypothetical protein
MDEIPLDVVPLVGLLALLPVAAFVLGRSPYVVMAAVSVGITVVALRLMFLPANATLGEVLDREPSDDDLQEDPLLRESD